MDGVRRGNYVTLFPATVSCLSLTMGDKPVHTVEPVLMVESREGVLSYLQGIGYQLGSSNNTRLNFPLSVIFPDSSNNNFRGAQQ